MAMATPPKTAGTRPRASWTEILPTSAGRGRAPTSRGRRPTASTPAAASRADPASPGTPHESVLRASHSPHHLFSPSVAGQRRPLGCRGVLKVSRLPRAGDAKRPAIRGIEPSNMRTTVFHWREYLTEALCLALFMLSAATFASLLRHPASPLAPTIGALMPRALQRVPMGIAMGLTAATLIYSPLGRRSGAHMNPAVTLTFLRLGKIEAHDAAAYVAAQFLGGSIGIAAATWVLRGLPSHPAINYVATVPGAAGTVAAFAAEAAISFGMMLTVLSTSNVRRLARFTGWFAAALIAIFT